MGPAALAVAEATGASGQAVLAAFALGLEVGGKLGRALGAGHYLKGWHSTATVGAFTSTAAAARLWGLTVEQLQTAWGLAASQVSGLVRNFGTMTKPFHAGNAARIGVLSAWMAKERLHRRHRRSSTARTIFSRLTATGDGEPLEKVIATLGKPWEMEEPGIYVKRWPCCYCNHRPVGGMIKLIKEHGIKRGRSDRGRRGFPAGLGYGARELQPGDGARREIQHRVRHLGALPRRQGHARIVHRSDGACAPKCASSCRR